MADYYVCTQPQANGDHEVHTADCTYMPPPENTTRVGSFENCREAVQQAKTTYPKANGCYYCCRPCHSG